jgi:hypothetical protein
MGHLVLYSVYVFAARKDVGGFLIDRRSAVLLSLAGVVVFFLPLLPSFDPSVRVALGATIALASLVVGPTAAEWSRLPRPRRLAASIAR